MSCSKRVGVRVEQESVPSSVEELAGPCKRVCGRVRRPALCTCRCANTARIFRPSRGQKSGVRWTQDMILGVLSSSLRPSRGWYA